MKGRYFSVLVVIGVIILLGGRIYSEHSKDAKKGKVYEAIRKVQELQKYQENPDGRLGLLINKVNEAIQIAEGAGNDVKKLKNLMPDLIRSARGPEVKYWLSALEDFVCAEEEKNFRMSIFFVDQAKEAIRDAEEAGVDTCCDEGNFSFFAEKAYLEGLRDILNRFSASMDFNKYWRDYEDIETYIHASEKILRTAKEERFYFPEFPELELEFLVLREQVGDGVPYVAHITESEETFSEICQNVLGCGREEVWGVEAEKLGIINPHRIFPGQIFIFPFQEEMEKRMAQREAMILY